MATPGDALPPDVNIAVPGLPIYIWIGCGLATVVVVARLITRLVIKKTAGWDDFFIGASYVRLDPVYIIPEILTHQTHS